MEALLKDLNLLTLYASGYQMSQFAQVSQTDSCDYSKYVFHVHILPHSCSPASTGPLSIDKQGYIIRATAVGSNLLVRLSSRDFNNAKPEIHNPTDDRFCFPADNHG